MKTMDKERDELFFVNRTVERFCASKYEMISYISKVIKLVRLH